MFLSKLKVTCVVALAVLVGTTTTGLSYRAIAGDPAQTPAAPARTRAARQDDLDELRLEIEALRKGLQATRERVKSLEDELQAVKRWPGFLGQAGGGAGLIGSGGGLGGGPGLGGGLGGRMGGAGQLGLSGGQMGMMQGGLDKPSTPNDGSAPHARATMMGVMGSRQGQRDAKPKLTEDPLSEAEAALKELRRDPGNKQAADRLGRALEEIKAHTKKNGDAH